MYYQIIGGPKNARRTYHDDTLPGDNPPCMLLILDDSVKPPIFSYGYLLIGIWGETIEDKQTIWLYQYAGKQDDLVGTLKSFN